MPKAAIASGIVLAVMTAAVIFGGTKRISVITSIVVPIMAIAYIAIALWTTITNITWLPQVFALVFSSAFDFQSIPTGQEVIIAIGENLNEGAIKKILFGDVDVKSY